MATIVVELTTDNGWTVPTGVTSIKIEAWGGGCNGLNGTRFVPGAGGGGGGYSRINALEVTPGTNFAGYVGQGNNTTTGGNTWMNHANPPYQAIIVAYGASTKDGGSTWVSADVSYAGGSSTGSGCGGGGGAGESEAGGWAFGIGGGSGGDTSGGNGGNAGTVGQPGGNGSLLSGGGGGGGTGFPPQLGGVGQRGLIRITYEEPAPEPETKTQTINSDALIEEEETSIVCGIPISLPV